MPDNLLPECSKFEEEATRLEAWLLAQPNATVTPLSPTQLLTYRSLFVKGWSCRLPVAVGVAQEFHVLLGRDYPFVPPRVGMATDERYMQWPHVEELGLLCLPKDPDAFADPLEAAAKVINYALGLVNECSSDPSYVRAELEREFQTYWSRGTGTSFHIYSLLDAANFTARRIRVARSNGYYLAAETDAASERWLSNAHASAGVIKNGVFGLIARPPIFPLPKSAREAFVLLQRDAPGAYELLKQLPPLDGAFVVLSAEAEGKRALVGLALYGHPRKGFRAGANHPAVKKFLWAQAALVLHEVDRVDGSWVHGRDVNQSYPQLKDSTIAIIGCGSVGSQAAVRLAQCGVGHLLLVDHETLKAANVGRHALGMDSLNKGKSAQLAEHIKKRFPHCESTAFGVRWENLNPEEWQRIQNADLIVSAIGDFSSESTLNEWHIKSAHPHPIVYCWLDPQGMAAHAVVVLGPRPCLNCLLDNTGKLLVQEFELPKEASADLREPGCGTEFQPFGALDVAAAEALLCDVVLPVLGGTITAAHHRIRAVSTARLRSLGGNWTPAHDAVRPCSITGAFEFERPMTPRADCPICK